MRFKTRPTLVEAFEVTSELSYYRIEMLFKALGYNMIAIRKENTKPFTNLSERLEFTVLNSNQKEIKIYCSYNQYICLQNETFVIKTKSDFESQFESIEPILTEIENQSF